MDPLAKRLLAGHLHSGETITVDVSGSHELAFTTASA